MKKIIIGLLTITISFISCRKDNDTVAKQNEIVQVSVEDKDLSHLDHAIFTKLDDGKLVIFFSQLDIKKYYDKVIDTKAKKSSITLPNQLFYIGVFPATKGEFPDLTKYQIGALNYTKIKMNPDLSISLNATQKYTATHVIVDANTPPIELGKYNININYLINDSIISGDFTGVMAKINLETELPDATAKPLSTSGSFENVEYIDLEKVKEFLPIDIGALF